MRGTEPDSAAGERGVAAEQRVAFLDVVEHGEVLGDERQQRPGEELLQRVPFLPAPLPLPLRVALEGEPQLGEAPRELARHLVREHALLAVVLRGHPQARQPPGPRSRRLRRRRRRRRGRRRRRRRRAEEGEGAAQPAQPWGQVDVEVEGVGVLGGGGGG